MKQFICIVVLCCLLSGIYGQGYEFLPKKNYWQTLTFDPLASQSYGSVAAFWQNGTQSDFMLSGFAFGFQKSFFAWENSEKKGFDVGLEGAAFAQYEIAILNGEFERNIITSDYIIGLPFVVYLKPWTIRFRIWHISAHLGDDYMLRNGVETYVKNNMRYEQVDVMASYQYKNLRFYLGAGAVFRANRYREPMVFNGGMEYKLSLNKKETVGFYTGIFADAKQELDYSPSINLGAGFQFGKPDRQPVRLLITYFYGPLPYSIYEGLDVMWLGAGIYINIF